DLIVGDTGNIISVTAHYDDGFKASMPLGDCKYLSSNDLIAIVSDIGVVTAVAKGTAIINVSYIGESDTVAVTVKELTVVYDSGQNATNKGLDRPYINWTIDGMCVEFEFVNPTVYNWGFNYRVDGEEGTPNEWSDATIGGTGELAGQKFGPDYNIIDMPAGDPGLTKTVTVCAEEEIWVGLRLGPENDWYLDWIIFKKMACE
ncbi:unnamed protein product, partial [marine sediment metagenome]